MTTFRYTGQERNWIMYDVGNSALVLLNTAITPIFVGLLLRSAHQEGIVPIWGYTQTIASLVIAIAMPFLGSLADYAGNKIKFFIGAVATGFICCLGMAVPLGWFVFIAIYVLSTIGLNSSMTFYDAMLPDVTTDARMDRVSSAGFAWGYLGSTVPFIACVAIILLGPGALGIDRMLAFRLTFIITAIWWIAFTIPLVRTYRQRYSKPSADHEVRRTLGTLLGTAKRITANKVLLTFMLGYFFYIDGVHTVIDMSTSYGTDLGIDATQLILALLVTQLVAFPSAIAYGKLAGSFGTLRMIVVGVLAYVCIVMFAAFFLRTAADFWMLAICVGLFQGGVQALSRSYFGKLIPKERSNEYYGFFDIFGRYASVIGTLLVSIVASLTGDSSLGVLSIGILLMVGLVMLFRLFKLMAVA